MTRTLQGRIVTPAGIVEGVLRIAGDGRIASIDGVPVAADAARDGKGPLLLPGFIDLHVHGGAGRDIMEGGDAGLQVARKHAEHGTTALLATTMTAPMEDLRKSL
ncbi:MAG TPA: N-acetylglucosamine-6-phosphate deacetylase, partial [Ramlibacter sp.]|nr:N-acetylglucosamine-6-phosphate deacetylase [Ramlibacter sp.]